MEGIILNYRRGRHTQYNNQMIITVDGINSKEEATKLVGKKVVYKTKSGKEIKGEIRSTHGNKGRVRVLFEKGMPGQSIGEKITILNQ